MRRLSGFKAAWVGGLIIGGVATTAAIPVAAAGTVTAGAGTVTADAAAAAAATPAAVSAAAPAATASAAEPASLATRVRQIEDREAIQRLLMEYGRSLDNRDFATYSHLFASNGEWSGGFGTFRGPAAIQAAMEKAFANATDIPKGTNFHMMSNVIIDLHGDRATASSKWIFFKMDGSKPEGAIAGRYDDELIREDGTWKFLKRVAAAPVDKDAPPSRPAAPAVK